MTPVQLAHHLRTDRYGTLGLTDAVRPAPDAPARLAEGYRCETYRGRGGQRIPTLAAAVSRERLFDTFLALLRPLGQVVDVVLETSHHSTTDRHRDLRRTDIDRPVLESYLCEYEGLLLNDGCAGVAVISTTRPMEVQFDEHKQLICYARNLRPFQSAFRAAGIPSIAELPLLSESAHLHHSRPAYASAFHELATRLGIGVNPAMSV